MPPAKSLPSGASETLTATIAAQWREQRPDLDHSSFLLGTMVTRLWILLQQLTTTPSRLGLRPASLRLLYALRRVGPPYAQRPTGLYRLLGVTSGAVSYTIGILLEQDLIEMVDDPDDKRSHLLRLTDAGLKLVDDSVTESARTLQRAAGDLTETQRNEILAALMTLASSWESFADSNTDATSQVED